MLNKRCGSLVLTVLLVLTALLYGCTEGAGSPSAIPSKPTLPPTSTIPAQPQPSLPTQVEDNFISKEQAISILLNEVIQPSQVEGDIIAFTLDEPLSPGDWIGPYLPKETPTYTNGVEAPYLEGPEMRVMEDKTWFFWVDDSPYARYSHQTRFVFISNDGKLTDVVYQGWWPVLNGESLWTQKSEYWNNNNWAYSSIDPDRLSEKLAYLLGNVYVATQFETVWNSVNPFRVLWWKNIIVLASPGSDKSGAIVINGWSSDQKGEDDFEKDAAGMAEVLKAIGVAVTQVNPPNNTPDKMKEAIKKAIEEDKYTNLTLFITAHGTVNQHHQMEPDVFPAADTTVWVGGKPVTPADIKKIANKYPNVMFKLIIDSCYSGGFIGPLKSIKNMPIIITSTNSSTPGYGDIDPGDKISKPWWKKESGTVITGGHDSNPDDEGGEFTSGFLEDMKEYTTDPGKKKELEKLAETWKNNGGRDAALYYLAFKTAKEKDAAHQAGLTEPQRHVNISENISSFLGQLALTTAQEHRKLGVILQWLPDEVMPLEQQYINAMMKDLSIYVSSSDPIVTEEMRSGASNILAIIETTGDKDMDATMAQTYMQYYNQ